MFYHRVKVKKMMIWKKMVIFSQMLVLAIFLTPSVWSTSDNSAQTQWLKKIENYMNQTRNWETDFEQLNPNGSLYVGKLYLQRPGRMRLVYTYPKNQIMLADGKWLIVHDPSHDELTTLALKETPADFFLKAEIDFSSANVNIQNFEINEGLISVTIVRADDLDAGQLTLTFSQSPLKLIQWVTIDANNLKTTINLKDIKEGKVHNSSFFTFNRPELLE